MPPATMAESTEKTTKSRAVTSCKPARARNSRANCSWEILAGSVRGRTRPSNVRYTPPASASESTSGINRVPRRLQCDRGSCFDCLEKASREASRRGRKASRGGCKASHQAEKASRQSKRLSREPFRGDADRRGIVHTMRRHPFHAARWSTFPDQPALLEAKDLMTADHASIEPGHFEDAGDAALPRPRG